MGTKQGSSPLPAPSFHPPCPQATLPFSAEWALSPGRTYTLIYRRVLVEDCAGEKIKFVAENAESRAQLRVKGNGSPKQGRGWTVCVDEYMCWVLRGS